MTEPDSNATLPYPRTWLDTAVKAAHKALAEVDDGWHYECTLDPDDQSCGKGFQARAMLAEDVMPRVLDALDRVAALNFYRPAGGAPHCPRCGDRVPLGEYEVCDPCARAEGWTA